MKKTILCRKSFLSEAGREITITYCELEDENEESDGIPQYGIMLVCENTGEISSAANVLPDKEKNRNLIRYLADMLVTPVTLKDVLYDILSNQI